MQDYTKLLVWQRARSLTVAIHEASRGFPSRSMPGLRSQLLRAVMSIATNIAEGSGRESRVDFARFVTMAAASASETEHHLAVASDLGLLDDTVANRLMLRAQEIRRMLFGLRRALLTAEGARMTAGALDGQAREDSTRPTDSVPADREQMTDDGVARNGSGGSGL